MFSAEEVGRGFDDHLVVEHASMSKARGLQQSSSWPVARVAQTFVQGDFTVTGIMDNQNWLLATGAFGLEFGPINTKAIFDPALGRGAQGFGPAQGQRLFGACD